MRATDLKFRSPKEKTPEFNLPVVTNQGRILFEAFPSKPKPSFGKDPRFRDYTVNANNTGYRVGPGSYKQDQIAIGRDRIRGTPVYRGYHRSQDLSNNAYLFVGNHIMFDASFLLPSRRHAAQHVTHQLDLTDLNKPVNPFYQRTSTAANTPSKHDRLFFARQKVMSPNLSEFHTSRNTY
jgi:hypothetical protein